MSGSTTVTIHAAALAPRTNTGNTVLLAFDTVTKTFAALDVTVFAATGTGVLRSGNGAPLNSVGQNGDFYIDQSGQSLYGPKANGAWPGGVSLMGTAGNTILSGTGVPASSLGRNGDFYMDTNAKALYGPKTGGVWGSGTSLIGPQGPAGTGGSGTANVANGTSDGQVAVWSASANQYVGVAGTQLTADRTPVVTLSAGTALTFALHQRRNLVLTALAALTLASTEVGASMEFVIQNDHTATNTITFGSGITVKQPSTGTGSGGAVKIAAGGELAVMLYNNGSTIIAKCRGDVA